MPAFIQKVQMHRALKRTLRRMSKRGQLTKEQAAFCRLVADSPAMTAKLADRVDQHVRKSFTAAPKEYPLLAWLWEHRAEILAFVLEIVKLFTAT